MTANTASTPTEVVADVAATVLGPIAVLEPVQGFVGNEAFRIRTATDQVFYLKSGPAPAIKAEAWACDRAGGKGSLPLTSSPRISRRPTCPPPT